MSEPKRHGPPHGSAKRVALPRLQRRDWPRWLEIADDRASWPDTFDHWQRESTERAERLTRAGLEIVWIDLEPESLVAWCKSCGYANDSEARNRYAAERIGNIPPRHE